MTINNKLKKIAELVFPNSFLLDVGCDHALLDIYLTSKNVRCIGSDINVLPLEKAKENIKKYEVEDKITLKVEKGKYGYYKTKSHKLIEINECLLAESSINNFIKDISYLKIKNGEVIIRSNYNNELLIWIKSKDKCNVDIPILKSKHKIAGIIYNDNVIDGDSSFVEIINHQLFTTSYDSFFQVNRNICSKLFINGKELDNDKYYTVATVDYLFDKTEYPFLKGQNIKNEGILYRDL